MFYRGDVCNQEGLGTVTAVYSNRWGSFWDCTLDDGRIITGLYTCALGTSEYDGFQTFDSYQARREHKIAQFNKWAASLKGGAL